MKQRDLARQMGTSTRTVSRWETNDQQVGARDRLPLVQALAKAPEPLVTALAAALAVPSPIAVVRKASPASLEIALFRAAEEHDLSPRRLRAAVLEVLAAAAALEMSPQAARESLTRQVTVQDRS